MKFKGWVVAMETKHVFNSFALYISIVLLRYKSRLGDIKIILSVSMFRENRLKMCRVTSVRALNQPDFASN
jgi:hypothetical protein